MVGLGARQRAATVELPNQLTDTGGRGRTYTAPTWTMPEGKAARPDRYLDGERAIEALGRI
jgi:hypothetical protein